MDDVKPAGSPKPEAPPAAGPVPVEELERLKQEVAQANDHYLRALAEVDNTKKRLQREKEEFAKYATESVIRELLPVIDGLSQALVAVDQQQHADPIIKGIHLIYRQLLGVLEREGVKRIPGVGATFDPHVHEAVEEVPTDGAHKDGAILEEVQVGYTMHGKVVRPAMVKVAKRSQTSDFRPQTSAQEKDNQNQPHTDV